MPFIRLQSNKMKPTDYRLPTAHMLCGNRYTNCRHEFYSRKTPLNGNKSILIVIFAS